MAFRITITLPIVIKTHFMTFQQNLNKITFVFVTHIYIKIYLDIIRKIKLEITIKKKRKEDEYPNTV
jgi:hypothetical protein